MNYQTYRVFTDLEDGKYGNTSPVVLLESEIETDKLQRIASDFWQPATTFLWKSDQEEWHVRWFAPDAEIELCGHGSLAAVAFLHNHLAQDQEIKLNAGKHHLEGGALGENKCYIILDAIPVKKELEVPGYLKEALNIPIAAYYETSNKNIVLTESQKYVEEVKPDYGLLRSDPTFGYIITAPGNGCDFVSRTFVPHVQQLEDPATGSSHAVLSDFWSKRLSKTKMNSLQLSARGGKFLCEIEGQSVKLTGEYQMLNSGSIASI